MTVKPRRIEPAVNHLATTGHPNSLLWDTIQNTWIAMSTATTQSSRRPMFLGFRAQLTSMPGTSAPAAGCAGFWAGSLMGPAPYFLERFMAGALSMFASRPHFFMMSA